MRLTFLCFAALLISACGLAMSNEDRLDRAEEALASGDYRAAIIDAKDVLRDEPDNMRGRVLLGRASAAVGDGPSAEKEMRRAIALGVAREHALVPLARSLLLQRKFQEIVDEVQPADVTSADGRVELSLIRGDAFMGLEQPAVARELYNDVIATSPDNIGAFLGVASSFRAESNANEARRTLDHVTSAFPDDVRGHLASGELYFSSQEFESASSDYETAAELARGSNDIGAEVQARTGLAESQLVLQQVEDARASVTRVAELAPDSLPGLFLTSRIAYLDEDWGTAQQNLQLILRRAPEYAPAQTLLGTVHLQSGNLSQAEMYLSSVVAADPKASQARQLLAETRLQMRDATEAQATLEPLLASDNPGPAVLAMAARASLEQGDSDAAIDFLRRSVDEDPENVDMQFRLAIALMNAGRNDEFAALLDNIDVSASRLDEFRRDMLNSMYRARTGDLDEGLLAAQGLVDDWPKNSNARNLLGSVLLARDDIAAARASFLRSAELQPGDLTAISNLAAIDEKEGDLEAARLRYELVLAGQPNATWAMFGLARIAAREENLGESQDWLQRIRTNDANAVSPRATLATLLMAEGKFREAEQVIDEALLVGGDVAVLHNLLGRARMGQDDHVGASIAFEKALELDPDNDQYRLGLANAQRQAGNESLAQETLLEDGDVYLDHIPSAVTVASMKVESGDLGGAMRIAKALQKRHPASPIPLALEAEIHFRGERLEDAAKAYERALSINVMRSHAVRAHQIKTELTHADRDEPLRAYLANRPSDSEVRMILAESLMAGNRIDESVGEYQKAVELSPDNGVALNNLAWTYYLSKDSRATSTARKALSLMPDNGAVADTLGWILVESGEVKEGVEVLQRAVELTNGRAEVRYHYAIGLAKAGDVDEARRILQDVISGSEDFSSRKDAERQLADL